MKVIPNEIWSRVVGYYRPTKHWNSAKQSEFADRKEYDLKLAIDKEIEI